MTTDDLTPKPAPVTGTAARGTAPTDAVIAPGDDRPKVSAKYIWLILLAQFGVFLAFITPMAFSLSVRVEDLAPANTGSLGYILGIGSAAILLWGPLVGVLSDRSRSRFGRRRPWLVGMMLIGVVSLFVMALAPNLFVLGLGWVLAQMGWNASLLMLTNSLADRLPESQRGKVAGFGGFVAQLAPALGAALGGMLATQTLLLFLVPGAVGVVLVLSFVFFVHEDDARGLEQADRLTVRDLAGKYVFNPRRYPDFSWNWLGRFLFYFGLTLNTTFLAFFFASRLGLQVTEVGGVVALAGGLGILGTMGGALGSGFLSDKVGRRKVFVVAAGLLFAVGTIVMALSSGLPVLLAGGFLTNLGIGVFAAVDQALALDVLPERDTDAGRFVAITQFATSIPQAIAPVAASGVLALTVALTGHQSYEALYVIAAVFTIAGGLVVLRVKSVR